MDAQVIPHGIDFVTKKQGDACSGMSNQSLFWRQFQVKFFLRNVVSWIDLFRLTLVPASPTGSHPRNGNI